MRKKYIYSYRDFENEDLTRSLVLNEGEDEKTDELIAFLREEDERERLEIRYIEENKDHYDDIMFLRGEESEPLVEMLPDISFEPQHVLYDDPEPEKVLLKKLRPVVDKLPPAMQEIYWLNAEGCGHTEIARMKNRTPGGVRSAYNKMVARLIELYIEVYGVDPKLG